MYIHMYGCMINNCACKCSKHLIPYNYVSTLPERSFSGSYEDLQARCVQREVKVAKLEEETGRIRIKFDLKMSW